MPYPAALATNSSQNYTYKLYTLMHNVHIGKSPRYLADIVQPMSSRVTRSGLRSVSETTSYMYITPRLRCCAPSLESGLSLSPAQHHGTLSPLNPFNASSSKLLLFEGSSVILV